MFFKPALSYYDYVRAVGTDISDEVLEDMWLGPTGARVDEKHRKVDVLRRSS